MPELPDAPPPAYEVTEAWQCIGCGKLDAPQPCIGVCKDRRVKVVDLAVLEAALARAEALRRRVAALEDALGRIARTMPRAGAWEPSYRAMQALARDTLRGGR